MKNLVKLASVSLAILSLNACASVNKTMPNVKTGALDTPVAAEQPTLNAGQFADALEAVKSQSSGDSITRPATSTVCQRLYENYQLMAGYAPTQSLPLAKPSGSLASILGGTLEVASGIAGIAGVAGGTDALLKSAQISNALGGTNTIVGLFSKIKNKNASKAHAAPKVKTIDVSQMAFSKGFQLNCPLAPLKEIFDQ